MVTTYLLMIETAVIFIDCVLLFISFFAYSDAWDNQHQHFTVFQKLVYSHGTTIDWENKRIEQESHSW